MSNKSLNAYTRLTFLGFGCLLTLIKLLLIV